MLILKNVIILNIYFLKIINKYFYLFCIIFVCNTKCYKCLSKIVYNRNMLQKYVSFIALFWSKTIQHIKIIITCYKNVCVRVYNFVFYLYNFICFNL